MEARQKEKKKKTEKNVETHGVRMDLLGHFLEADF